MDTNGPQKRKLGVKLHYETVPFGFGMPQELLDQLSEAARRDPERWKKFFSAEQYIDLDKLDHGTELLDGHQASRPNLDDVKRVEDSLADLQRTLKLLKDEARRNPNQSKPADSVSELKREKFGNATITVGPKPRPQRASFLASVSVFLPPATREDIKDVMADLNRTRREMEAQGCPRRRVSIVITAMSLRSLLGILWCSLMEHAPKALPFRLRL